MPLGGFFLPLTSDKNRKSVPIRSGSRQGFRSVLKRDNEMLDAFRYKRIA